MKNTSTPRVSPRILIVEDDPSYLAMIEEYLSEEDYDIHVATNGTDAIALLQNEFFDLLVTDIVLPRQTGNEVIEAAMHTFPRPRIIAISGGGRTANMQFLRIAESQGIDAVIEKPFDLSDLLDTVSDLLAQNPPG